MFLITFFVCFKNVIIGIYHTIDIYISLKKNMNLKIRFSAFVHAVKFSSNEKCLTRVIITHFNDVTI